MFNPLLPSTDDLKIPELENKITELTKKYFIASRSGNSGLAQQILYILETYKAALQTKLMAAKVPTPNGGSDLDKLINID